MSEQYEQRIKQSQSAKRTNLAEWFAERVPEQEIDLPSGLHVVAKDIDLEDLILIGGIPNTLVNQLAKVEGMSNTEAVEKIMADDPASMGTLLDAYVRAALIEPRVGDETDIQNGVLGIKDIPGKDKFFIFEWMNREASSVKSFREGEG